MSAERAGPNGEPGSKPFWRWSANALLAAGTDAAVAFDAGDDGAQRRQVDVVVGMDLRQVGGAKCVGAVWTGSKCRLDDPVRVFGQRAGDARTAATGLLRTVGGVRLLALRGRDARVVRRLCWSREPAFVFRNTCRQDADLLSLRLDLRLLCLHQGDQVTVRKGEKGCAVHPSPVGDSAVTVSSRILSEGGE
jgi:hypothetical protein